MRGHPACPVLGLEQRLGNNRTQRFGQHGSHHLFLIGGEYVDNPVYGLGCRAGVQCAKYQMASFRRCHRKTYGFQVAHFADEDHVGVFTQRGAQGVVERQGVAAYFALVDQALLGFVHKFDRVFHGQNMALFLFVDVIDHRRQCGGFA